MPQVTDASWAPTHGWLRVKRVRFVPLQGDTTEVFMLYKSALNFTHDTTIDPGGGVIEWNNSSAPSITQVAISKTDRNALDQTAAIANLHIGDQMFVQETTDRRFTVEVIGVPVDMGTWFQIDVAYVTAAGIIVKNRDLNVDLTLFPQTLPQGTDRIEINMAQEWPWVLYRIFDDGSGAVVPYEKGIFPTSDIRAIEVF